MERIFIFFQALLSKKLTLLTFVNELKEWILRAEATTIEMELRLLKGTLYIPHSPGVAHHGQTRIQTCIFFAMKCLSVLTLEMNSNILTWMNHYIWLSTWYRNHSVTPFQFYKTGESLLTALTSQAQVRRETWTDQEREREGEVVSWVWESEPIKMILLLSWRNL